MNDPERRSGQDTGSTDNNGAVQSGHVLDATGREYPDTGTTPETKGQKIKRYYKKLLAEKPDRHIELALTLAISFFAFVQLMVTCSNNSSTADQAGKMILITQRNERAANKIADASKRNAVAAESFSTSAEGIKQGVSNAVGKLNTQAIRTRDLVSQTTRLAEDNETAIQLARDSAEMQFGANRPMLEIVRIHRDVDAGTSIASMKFTVENTGISQASNITYRVQGPLPLRLDAGSNTAYMERLIREFQNKRDLAKVGIPDLLAHDYSEPIVFHTGSFGGENDQALHRDNGMLFLGVLDWQDFIGFGHESERVFCIMTVVDRSQIIAIKDCGVSAEAVTVHATNESKTQAKARTKP